MDIILDTNIFRNDLFFNSKDFDILRDYLRKTDSRFVLPQIIIEELKGLYKRTLDENQRNYNKARKNLNQGLNYELVDELNINCDEEVEKYIDFVYNKLGRKEEKNIPYKNEYLPEIVKRAINKQKPFKDEDKGFRDSIIWLTILDYCQGCHEKQITFISNNPKDFGDIKDPTELHYNLKKECQDLGIKVNYFRTIKDFIEKHSKKIDLFDHDWIANNLDFEWLSDVICYEINDSNNYRIISWYEYKNEKESTGNYRILRAIPYDQDDLFIYEMVNGSLIINFTISTEIETEFEYYGYDYYGSEEFRNVHNETTYLRGKFHIGLVYQDNEIKEIELSDYELI
ncbi:PIN domain-containing protein [Aquimarina algiphila]|uniref:PIN domain-containing protein n=1 Tax=Aquimarina algiphila TaxID=2047982 RepID=UPI00248FD223|nr:PIN domain-containing protein [Aquimarina algiphila]